MFCDGVWQVLYKFSLLKSGEIFNKKPWFASGGIFNKCYSLVSG
jgi:hypothetical protein